MFKSFFLISVQKYFLFKEDFFRCYIFLNKNGVMLKNFNMSSIKKVKTVNDVKSAFVLQ